MQFEHDFAGDTECWVRLRGEVTTLGLSHAVASLMKDPAMQHCFT